MSLTRLSVPLALMAVAWGLRLLYLAEYRHSPFFDAPIVDAHSFYQKALAIAGGDLGGEDEAFWQPPLYIYWLALCQWLLPDAFFTATRLAQSLFGALSCLLVYRIAERVAGPRVALIAGGMAAAYGVSLYFEAELLAVSLEVLLDLALVHRLMRACAESGRKHWLLAGALAGLAALTRPTVLLFVAAVPLWLAYRRRSAGAWTKSGALFLLPCALVILPVTLRNYAVDGDWVLISTNGGINFYLGNNPEYERTVNIRPGMPWEDLVMEPVHAGYPKAAQRSAYFTGKSLDYIASQPLDWAALMLKKCYLFWAAPEIKRNQDVYYARQHSRLLSLLLWDFGGFSFPFGLVGPLALVGLVATWRRREAPWSILRLFTLSYMAAVVLFFVTARYRMPVLPGLLIFAAWTLDAGFRALKNGARTRLVRLGGPALLLGVLLNLPSVPPLAADAQIQFHLGEVYLRKEAYPRAVDHALAALALEPDFNYARHNLAVAYFHLGRYAEAIEAGRRTVAENPRRADTHILLGRALAATGQAAAAAERYRHALQLDPEADMAHYYYGRLLAKSGRLDEAAKHFDKALKSFPGDFWLRYELAQVHQRQGRLDQALKGFEAAYRLKARPEALNALGAVHFQRGDLEAARGYFDRALALDPGNRDAGVNRAVIDLETGQPARAATALEDILRRHPGFGRAAGALAEAYRRTGKSQQARALEQSMRR